MKKTLIITLFLCYAGIFILASNLKLDSEKEISYIVKATMYTIDKKQTDSSPLVTASGFNLHPTNPKKHRIIAISRDLSDSINFGSKVRLENAGEYSGEYIVEDIMNKRFKKRIDILINPKDRAISFDSVKLVLIKN
jgi:3D (Asp-Asp-Asp) domain-containing protein